MSEPIDYNVGRTTRAMSERRFLVGPYTFKRKASVEPDVIMRYQKEAEGMDSDAQALGLFDGTFVACVEPAAVITLTGEAISAPDAWHFMRHEGDENGVLSIGDIATIVQACMAAAVERPTGEPSDSQDGSAPLNGGTISTATSPFTAEPVSTTSMLAERSTPLMPT